MVSLPSKERFRCEILSWNRVVRDTIKLSKSIIASGFKPDIVVAIGRGGYVPARILCDYLLIRDLTSIKVEHWGSAATETEKAVIKFRLCTDIKDKSVLLVDDITDTGDTLRVSLKYLKDFGPKTIKTAVLIHKTCSVIVPDYFISKIIKWHIWEDLTGFVKNIKDKGIHDEEDISRELKLRYNINVQMETLREVLAELKK